MYIERRFASFKSKNFGCGRQIKYAGRVSQQIARNNGCHGTVNSHARRWNLFADFVGQTYGIRDARYIGLPHLVAFGEHLALRLAAREISVAYAQGLICSINVTMHCLRGDSTVWLSPSETVGPRSTVRATPPAALDLAVVTAATEALRAAGYQHAAACFELARAVGLRVRETALLDVRAALQEAIRFGYVVVKRGTKGGRQRRGDPIIARHVPATPNVIAALQRAAAVTDGQDTANLIPEGMSWIRFDRKIRPRSVVKILDAYGLRCFHDGRAAYACARYEELTGCPAPVVAGQRLATREADRAARAVIARELGHGRIDVLRAYVGSSR